MVVAQLAPEVQPGRIPREGDPRHGRGLDGGCDAHVLAQVVEEKLRHFPPPEAAVRASEQRALPGWVVFPKYLAGAPARLVPLERARAFMQLIENAFNYDIYGAEGFDLLGTLVDQSDCYTFEYGDLEQAVALFDRLGRGEHV